MALKSPQSCARSGRLHAVLACLVHVGLSRRRCQIRRLPLTQELYHLVEIAVVHPGISPILPVPGVQAHQPHLTNSNEIVRCLDIQRAELPYPHIPSQKRWPAFVLLPLTTRTPAKHRDIIGAPAHPTTIKVKKGQRLVMKMRIPAMQVSMTKTSFERAERKIL